MEEAFEIIISHKKCLNCGEIIKDGYVGIKKFCCKECRRQYNYPLIREQKRKHSKIYYHKHKEDRKKKNKKYFEVWKEKHPERFKELMRNVMRKRNNIKPENYRV